MILFVGSMLYLQNLMKNYLDSLSIEPEVVSHTIKY
jgi:hypothetical protein